jgi:hypothetical protein
MIKPISKNRVALPLNDFQVLKGKCERTMKPFGEPVSLPHEARLLIRDDQQKLAAGASALYVVHQRSENRIVHVVHAAGRAMKAITKAGCLPLPKAA